MSGADAMSGRNPTIGLHQRGRAGLIAGDCWLGAGGSGGAGGAGGSGGAGAGGGGASGRRGCAIHCSEAASVETGVSLEADRQGVAIGGHRTRNRAAAEAT